jgi:enterochelin esterase-like enzyme
MRHLLAFAAMIASALPSLPAAQGIQPACHHTVVGDVRLDSVRSTTYGDQRTIRVWLPPGYDAVENAQTRYPVLYMFDGQTLFDTCTAFSGEGELRLDEAATRLIAEHKIPPIIIVGMDSSSKRGFEYSVYPDPISNPSAPEPIGKQLPAFVSTDVAPYVASHYRVSANPTETAIGGTSLGGVAALYVLLQRPDLFGMGLLESPTVPTGNGQLLRDTENLGRGPDRIYVGVGMHELSGPMAEKFATQTRMSLETANAGFVTMTETLVANLKKAHLNRPSATLVVDPNGNHNVTSWERRLPNALVVLYGAMASVR